MQKFFVKSYGMHLVGRSEGAEAFAALKGNMRDVPEDEKVFFDFSDITMLAPSWCDEFFGEATLEYPGRIIIDDSINEGLRKSFEIIEETRDITFHFGPYVDNE